MQSQSTENQPTNQIIPPTKPGEWSLHQIEETIKRPLPPKYLTRLKDKGNAQTIAWYRVNAILMKYAPGWTWEIRHMITTPKRIFISGRLTIPTKEGNIYREATGTELLEREVVNKETGEVEIKEIAYGDPSSNAEAMAFRRAAMKFGLGLYLKEK